MIRELLTYFSENPKLKEAKKFGHLVESISLLSRERRCKKNWLPHRTECKDFILAHIKKAKHFESILILGSGPLHEIPINELAQKFSRVVLVDIVHLKSTKKSIQHLKNVEFIEHDITETEGVILQHKKLSKKTPERFLNEDWGMVLSVNIMSQLPLHLETYIKTKLKNHFKEEEIKHFLNSVTENHFLYLQSFNSPTVLITDTKTYYYDQSEKLLEGHSNYAHLTLPTPLHEWIWNVAPIPEFQKDIAIKMLVSGFVFKTTNSR